jgi:3-hydroxyisobutyrate dehydrogenase-like beta-hydroxyacid dehydrogenase
MTEKDANKSGRRNGRKGTVGVVGLGIMGGAMARSLLAGGWRVVGFDVDPGAASAASRDGIEVAESAQALAQVASDIITSLPSPEAVIVTAQAVANSPVPKRVLIETSTLSLQDKEKVASILEAKGHAALDCPLSGTGAQAKVKDLVIYASGNSAEIARLAPLFMGLGRKYFDLGAFGNGTKMKFVANHLVAIHNVASAEAMVLGLKAGLDPHQIVEVIGSGAGTSRVFELRAPLMADNRYEPATMRNAIWQKDMKVIGEFAAQLACPTPLFSATKPIYAATLTMGLGAQDTAAVCAVLEKMAGVTR